MPVRVLVVDDDASLRNGIAKLLTTSGYEVLTAASVAEAIERLALSPSHLTLDMDLPDGPGTAVLQHVRAHQLPIRVAVLSGSLDPSLLAHAQQFLPDTVFRKPPDWDKLLEWIEKTSGATIGG